jgi:hypothetical protein
MLALVNAGGAVMSNTERTVESLAARLDRQAQSMRLLWVAVVSVPMLWISFSGMWRSDKIRATSLNADTVFAQTLALSNKMGEIVALLHSSSDGSPQISLFDRQKKLRMSLSLRANGTPVMSLLDADSRDRSVLSLNERHEASLVFYEPTEPNDQKGPQRVMLTVDTGGSGLLYLFGSAGALNLATGNGRMKWTPVGGTAQDLPLQK